MESLSKDLLAKTMSEGMATEYLALMMRYHTTALRLYHVAKKYYPIVMEHLRLDSPDAVNRDLMKNILHNLPNDKSSIKRSTTWVALDKFLQKKLSTIKNRFQYRTNPTEEHLHNLSKSLTLETPATIQDYAKALSTVISFVEKRRNAKATSRNNNRRFFQELLPLPSSTDDVKDSDIASYSHMCSQTPLPAYVFPEFVQLLSDLADATASTTENAPKSMSSSTSKSMIASLGLELEHQFPVINPDCNTHKSVVEYAVIARNIGFSSSNTSTATTNRRSFNNGTEMNRPGNVEYSCCASESYLSSSIYSQSTEHAKSHSAYVSSVPDATHPPVNTSRIFLLVTREKAGEDRWHAVMELTFAATAALHHNAPGDSWKQLEGHIFCYGMLLTDDNTVGLCGFALGRRIANGEETPRIYRKDIFLSKCSRPIVIVQTLITNRWHHFLNTYQHVMGEKQHPNLRAEGLKFLKECDVRVVGDRVHGIISLPAEKGTYKTFDRTFQRMWSAWQLVHGVKGLCESGFSQPSSNAASRRNSSTLYSIDTQGLNDDTPEEGGKQFCKDISTGEVPEESEKSNFQKEDQQIPEEQTSVPQGYEEVREEWTDQTGLLRVGKLYRDGIVVGITTTYLGCQTGILTREHLLDVCQQLLRLSIKGLVHGDVRNANIVTVGMNHAYLIDFETVRRVNDVFPSWLDTELAERHPDVVGYRILQANSGSGFRDCRLHHDWFALRMCFTIQTGREFESRSTRAQRIVLQFLDDILHTEQVKQYNESETAIIRRLRDYTKAESWP